jgi:hypothetical protein
MSAEKLLYLLARAWGGDHRLGLETGIEPVASGERGTAAPVPALSTGSYALTG